MKTEQCEPNFTFPKFRVNMSFENPQQFKDIVTKDRVKRIV